ncbi:hypothetical protein NDU88_007357 [Pleurodeles waltl]|uniref:Uncharacterized protein n=1 Tax=Pleurodeles waltl TaxID=8319 RepID=A0AAV7VQ87_PLEWA|nr:hypothetical protein NDU88_007357 [Pleurodeles waltl]
MRPQLRAAEIYREEWQPGQIESQRPREARAHALEFHPESNAQWDWGGADSVRAPGPWQAVRDHWKPGRNGASVPDDFAIPRTGGWASKTAHGVPLRTLGTSREGEALQIGSTFRILKVQHRELPTQADHSFCHGTALLRHCITETHGRLRVVAPTGTEFFSSPEEAWAWLGLCSAPDLNNNSQYSKKRQRPRSRRRQTAHRVDPFIPDEVQEERQRVMEVVALFGGGPGGLDAASLSSP